MSNNNLFDCNNTTVPHPKKSPGVFIPTSWFQHIIHENKAADLTSITLLSEILYWYRPGRNGQSKLARGVFETSYRKLEEKFRCSRQTLRRAFVKLERMGLVMRELKTFIRYGRKYNNVLCVILKNKNLIENPDDLGLGNDEIFSDPHYKSNTDSLQNDIDIIDNMNSYNNRSTDLESQDPKSESNFLNKSCSNSSAQNDSSHNNKIIKKKRLADFHPLNQKDCDILQTKSGRNFNINAMNEILLTMSKRLGDREFISKNAFLNYMSKALHSEMRQAEKINNPDFKIKSNLTKNEIAKKETEEYLGKIEKSPDISPLSRFKKKIAGCFDGNKAHEIIKNLHDLRKDDQGKVKAVFNKKIHITSPNQKILYDQIMAVYDVTGNMDFDDIEIIFPICAESNNDIPKKLQATPIPDNIWGNIRLSLRKIYGEGYDISWFGALDAKIDETSKKLSLQAPNKFMSEWVDTHYKRKISSLAHDLGFELENIYAG